jgi:hypothetical protein
MFWLKVPNKENLKDADYEILPLSAWKNISPEMRDQVFQIILYLLELEFKFKFKLAYIGIF